MNDLQYFPPQRRLTMRAIHCFSVIRYPSFCNSAID